MSKILASTIPPLTIDLTEKLLHEVKALQRRYKARSLSEVVRFALQQYNFGKYKPEHEPHQQISIRLPLILKTKLFSIAKNKDVSVGELLRVALVELCSNPPKNQTIKTMVTAKKKAKKSTKKVVKKSAKKAAKRK